MNSELNIHLLELLRENNLLDKCGEISVQDTKHLLLLVSKKMDERDVEYEKFKAILDYAKNNNKKAEHEPIRTILKPWV